MAVKHLNFAGKTAVGQAMMPRAKRVKKYYPQATQKKATLQPPGGGRLGGETVKSGGGYTSNPTYGKGLGLSTPAKKKIGKVKGQ